MDKEAQKKTPFDHLTATINDYTLAGAYRLGFKHARIKLPEGEPPLLSDYRLYFRGYNIHVNDTFKKHIFDSIAQAQRDSDTKWRKGE